MKARLDVWDDDESDELFYTDRYVVNDYPISNARSPISSARWRSQRARRLATEESADNESRLYEERETENLRRESEAFLARQMDEMQALQDEQRKAGMLLEDGAPVKLNVSLAPIVSKTESGPKDKAAVVFGQEEEEDDTIRKRKVILPKLDLAEGGDTNICADRQRDSVQGEGQMGWSHRCNYTLSEAVDRLTDLLFF
jgi:RNA-binding protein 25